MSEENSERSDGVTNSQTKRRGNEAAEATQPKLAKTTDSTVSLPTTSSPLASQREKDEEGEEDVKRRCIRRKIFGELDTVIECDTDRIRRFKDCAKEFLPDGSVSEDDDVHDILKKLEDAGKIEPGNYGTLKEILKIADLPHAMRFVSGAEGEEAFNSGTSMTQDPIKAHSKKYIADCKEHTEDKFVETEPCKEARKTMDKHKTLLILGGMGDGKTFVVEYIALHMSKKGYRPIPCKSATDIQRYIDQVQDKSINLLFVFDNILREFYTKSKYIGEWENAEYLSMDSPHKFLFASRENDWENCRVHLKENSLFCTKVRATSAALSLEDKRNMLEIYSIHSKNLTDAHKDKIVTNEKPISFGQCCRLMYDADVGLSGESLVQIFLRPLSYLCLEIEKMSDSARGNFAVLCLIMLCGGEVDCKELTKTLPKVTPLVKEKIHGLMSTTGCKYGKLAKCAKNLASTGTYLKKEENKFSNFTTYTFCHDCFHEAVVMVYSKDHLCNLLDDLDIGKLIESARPGSYRPEQEEFAVVVSVDYYDNLAERFVKATVKGHLEEVFQNLCMGDKAFQSALCEYVKTLPRRELDAFRQSKHSLFDRCALYYVARLGSKQLLEILIAGCPVKCDCGGAFCLLRGAAEGNRVEIVKHVLLSYKRTIEQIHEAAKSACKAHSVDVLKILWDYIADDPTYGDQRAQTKEDCLWVACWHNCREILIYLLHIGDIGCKSDPSLCEEKIPISFGNSHKVIVEILLSHGARVNQSGHKGNTCLHKAARKGEDDTVIYIIQEGLSVNTPDEKGISPLHLASNSLRPKVVITLLENGAQINMKDEWGFTPLHAVLIRDIQSSKKLAKRREVVKTLLSYSADVNTEDKWHRTALSLAKEKCISDILEIFAEQNIDMTTSVGEHLPFRKPEPQEVKTTRIWYKTGE